MCDADIKSYICLVNFITDSNLRVSDGQPFVLSAHDTKYTGGIASNKQAMQVLNKAKKELYTLQRKLYASGTHSVLLVFQAMDAAGKDSTVRHVFSGINPAGFKVSSFKAPSKKELAHDFLWRCNAAIPDRGRIGVFNRSHYEEVLVCKVHPEYILGQNIPSIKEQQDLNNAFWETRYQSIAQWENHLAANGTVILKFFLNVGRDEQKARFMSRIAEKKKNWKFNFGDLEERSLWPEYMTAYQEAIQYTASEQAPWYVIPADNKPIMRAMVASIVADRLTELDLKYPQIGEKERAKMEEAKKILENE